MARSGYREGLPAHQEQTPGHRQGLLSYQMPQSLAYPRCLGAPTLPTARVEPVATAAQIFSAYFAWKKRALVV